MVATRKARGRGARAKLAAAATLEEPADRCKKVATQIKQRVTGGPISDRLASLSDPDVRPIRNGKFATAARDLQRGAFRSLKSFCAGST